MSQEKTEKPTPQRLRKARREGQQARTPDLGAWAVIAVGVNLLPGLIEDGYARTSQLLATVAVVAERPEPQLALQALTDGLSAVLALITPLAVASVIAALLAGGVQGGLNPAWAALKPKWNRLNPVSGIKQHFGPMAWWQAAQNAIKTLVLIGVTWWTVSNLIPVLVGAGALPLSASLQAVHGSIVDLVTVSVGVGIVLAGADYAIRARRTTKQLRMTKQEVKEENRNAEGDPMIRAARRSRAIALARSRMMKDVETADAVLVNPTHIAVAVRYEPGRGAPRVVAKGSGHLAGRIRERAREHGVPLVADVGLARALYAACRVGEEIPAELFEAVAQILAFLFTLRRTRPTAAPGPEPLTVPRPRARP